MGTVSDLIALGLSASAFRAAAKVLVAFLKSGRHTIEVDLEEHKGRRTVGVTMSGKTARDVDAVVQLLERLNDQR
jgi:hypothetical protein